MCRDGMRLWNRYPRETVKPSFEPQPPSFMLKIRFLERSVRKYEKNCSDGHGGLAVFLTRKISKNRKKRVEKIDPAKILGFLIPGKSHSIFARSRKISLIFSVFNLHNPFARTIPSHSQDWKNDTICKNSAKCV